LIALLPIASIVVTPTKPIMPFCVCYCVPGFSLRLLLAFVLSFFCWPKRKDVLVEKQSRRWFLVDEFAS